MSQPEAFAVFHGYICTANKDGSIPLDSRIVAKIVPGETNVELLTELLRRANREFGD